MTHSLIYAQGSFFGVNELEQTGFRGKKNITSLLGKRFTDNITKKSNLKDQRERGKMMKKRMSAWLIIIFFLIIGLIVGCSGRKEEEAKKEKELTQLKEEVNQEENISEEEEEASSPQYVSTNTPPKIVSARIIPDPAYTNTDLSVEVECEDIDGDLITYTYQWMKAKEGDTVDKGVEIEGETESTLSHEKFVRGDAIAVKVTPFDGRDEGLTYRTKYVVIANSPPEITSRPPEIIPNKKIYTYQVEVSDPDGDQIKFSLGEGAPEGMTIDPQTGLITWPIAEQFAGTYEIYIYGDDGHNGTCSQHYTLTLEYKQIMPEEGKR